MYSDCSSGLPLPVVKYSANPLGSVVLLGAYFSCQTIFRHLHSSWLGVEFPQPWGIICTLLPSLPYPVFPSYHRKQNANSSQIHPNVTMPSNVGFSPSDVAAFGGLVSSSHAPPHRKAELPWALSLVLFTTHSARAVSCCVDSCSTGSTFTRFDL